MNVVSTITLITKVQQGEYNQKIQRYLDKGYRIESLAYLQEYDDGMVTVRVQLSYPSTDLAFR